MQLKCELEKPTTGQTLADLEPGVLALVDYGFTEGPVYRWRDGRGGVYGLNSYGYPQQMNSAQAEQYKIVQILGKIKMEICS